MTSAPAIDVHFVDVTSQAGIKFKHMSSPEKKYIVESMSGGVALFDYDNNGNGTFTDVTQRAGVGDPRWSTGAAFVDYDNDGKLDLFVSNYVDFDVNNLPEFGKGRTCQFKGVPVQCGPRGLKGAGDSLYHNNGDGTFTDVSKKAGVAYLDGFYGLGVIASEFDEAGL